MSTTVIPVSSLQAAWRPKAMGGFCASYELVKAFGDRIYSVAKHITQDDEDAEEVLMETFLEVCPDLDGSHEGEGVWLQLAPIAVRKAFSKLRNRSGIRPRLDPIVDSSEDLVIREYSVWGDNDQQPNSVLEHGLRSLDPMCRAVFVLRDIEEIPAEDTAGIVNRSVAAVEVCLLRARLQLREMLARQMRLQ